MNWLEEVLIILGISLDIFATMACQGALVAKIEKKHLALLCALVSVWQLAALCLGDLVATLLGWQVNSGRETFLGRVLAAVIFFCLGLRLLVKAWKNERIVEKREENLDWKRFLLIMAVSGNYTFLTGIAFGFLSIHLLPAMVMILSISILVVALGMYTGYRLGFEQKRKAYAAGTVLLLAAGVDVIVRYLVR